MPKKNFRAASALVAVTTGCALLLTACGQDSEGGSQEKKDKKDVTIGIAMPTKSSERWIADGRNMTASLKKAGFATTLQYGEDDPPTSRSPRSRT